MPVNGFQYNTRPYSSFRATRGSCTLQHTTAAPAAVNSTNLRNSSKTSLNSNNNSPAAHNLQISASSSAISVRNNNNLNGCLSNNFQRQQPFRSSFYGTRYNHKTSDQYLQTNSKLSAPQTSASGAIAVKPLTPKLVRRIESTCSTHHTKAKAPAPPASVVATNPPPTAQKQYLKSRNLPPTPPLRKSSNFDRYHQANLSIRQKTLNSSIINSRASCLSSSNGSQESVLPKYQQNLTLNNGNRVSMLPTQKRAYKTVSKLTKENQPKTENNVSHYGPVKSTKSYPAPLPPQQVTPKVALRRKCKEETRLSSVSASPNLNNRRFISSVGVNSFNASCNPKSTPLNRRKTILSSSTQINMNGSLNMPSKIGSTSSNTSSTPSSASQGSPKSKKAFSTKFPQGLPFEDEFYRRQRSYSQSSSNYSFYSSNGAHTTAPPTPHSYDNEEDDEFQRKPSTDEPLYVDFSKVMQRHEYKHSTNTKYHTTTTLQPTNTKTWICGSSHKNTTTSTYDTSLNSPQTQRRSSYQQQQHQQHSHFNLQTTTGTNTSLRSTKTKYSQSINDYLYTSNGAKLSYASSTTSDSRKSLVYNSSKLDPLQNADNGYYTHASPESSPTSPSNSQQHHHHVVQQTDTYVAVSSWAPKCSHPTKVLIPATVNSNVCDSNNNKGFRPKEYRPEDYYEKTMRYNGLSSATVAESGGILERTNSEYR